MDRTNRTVAKKIFQATDIYSSYEQTLGRKDRRNY